MRSSDNETSGLLLSDNRSTQSSEINAPTGLSASSDPGRRRFLLQSASLAGLAVSVSGCTLFNTSSNTTLTDPAASGNIADPASIRLASSVKTETMGHQLLQLQQSPQMLPSQWRGHQVAMSPDGRYLVSVARRPGRQLLVQDLSTQRHWFVNANEGRHFYGHGIFSADGSLLYCPENDYDNAEGKIGIYSVHQGFKKLKEWSSYGTGPHQIAWLKHQGDTLLVVANGGIETHPDYPRIKLNLDIMQPNISYLNLEGQLADQATPPHHQLSLRHLDTSSDGRVWVGAQYQGEIYESPNLVYNHAPGESDLTAVKAEDALWPGLKAYIASVSCHSTADSVCVTAPRDNKVTFWQRSSGQMIRTMSLADCAGVCAHPILPVYYVSSGDGTLAAFDANNGDLLWQKQFEGIHWDNHLTWAS
ncbi:DUF1513 domain-containing protein [Oceanospirillum sediminis]|uniref:DUF1513 domain-containing protein n=1 Tax=Oceanospirillum sediminis TaxID=2760088 RepID=A0A839IUM4_9GAMM|nr:DUF1513 domain-containing protein [Oceanospirillum sediminis]MBB1489153.1 DUF1513 domain-containing protein [Oceanospirillum sediminis]